MPALTIRQPWAALVVTGRKRIEWRTWATSHRGPLLIHAAARPAPGVPTPRPVRGLASVTGALIGQVSVTGCERCPCGCGMWGWVLDDPMTMEPVPMTGRLGLWDVTSASGPRFPPS